MSIHELVCLLVTFSIYSVMGTPHAVSLPTSDIWEPLGPEGGAVSAIACAEKTQIIYAATGDGVYKSINGGESWQRSCDGLGSSPGTEGHAPGRAPIAYSSLAIDGDTIYVGASDGVYKSIDAGETWKLCSKKLVDITCLAIAPTEPNVIYAAAGIEQSLIYRSTDHGENWLPVDESLETGRFYSLVVHPQNSGVIYVARDNTFIEQNIQTGWKKDDMGLISAGIWCVAVNSRDVYVGTSAGVFRSSDGCKTFSMTSIGLPPNITIIQISDVRHENLKSEVSSPNSEEASYLIYAYSPRNGLYRSDDGGNNWQLLSEKLNTVQCLTFASPDTIYAGTQGRGIYKSADGGKSWKAINSGLRNFDVLSFACTSVGEIYVSSMYGGLCKSIDGGNTWRYLRLDELLVENIIVGQLDEVYANIDNGLYRSASGRNGWEQVTTGPDDVITLDLAVHPSNPSVIYAATWGDGIYRGSNGGNWKQINEGLIDKRVSSIEIAPSNNGSLYAQTYHGILHGSTDAGENWSQIQSPIAGSETSLLAISPRQANTIYVRAGDSMFKSANFGRSFGRIRTPQDSVPLALAIDRSRSETLYLGAENPTGKCEIYKSVDDGKSWFPLGNGFPNVIVNTLSIHPVDANVIYAGTSGGVFRLVQRAPGETKTNAQISDVINYPNPFTPSEGTTFRYTLPHDSLVTIKIFNTAGAFIRTVIEDAAKSFGTHNDTWDGRDEHGNIVSFGMYIYNITATFILDESNVSTVSKVLLVKP